jgi:hypothetical protein
MTGIDGTSSGTASGILYVFGDTLGMFSAASYFVSIIVLAPAAAKSAGKNIKTREKRRNIRPAGQIRKSLEHGFLQLAG